MLTIRKAGLEDAETLLNWRNDEDTRSESRTEHFITQDEHLNWLSCVLKDDSRELYIVEHEGVSVGTVRVDRSDSGLELSWTVRPELRGKGLGKRMVAMVANAILDPIEAFVKVGNYKSIAIARSLGMEFVGCENALIHFKKKGIKE